MSTDGLGDGSLPRRRESWHRDRYNWYWDAKHVVRYRLHHRWKVVRCRYCGESRYCYLKLLLQRAWRAGGGWAVRSKVVHSYHKGEPVLIEPPRKPRMMCRCLAWSGPGGLGQQRVKNT